MFADLERIFCICTSQLNTSIYKKRGKTLQGIVKSESLKFVPNF